MFSPSPIPALPSIAAPTGRMAIVSSDAASIQRIVEILLERSGLSQAEACRRMGIAVQSLNQYKKGRRVKTSLPWLARLAEVCGGRILVEFPANAMEVR